MRRVLPSLTREEATSSDSMLLIGGLALFVLVLADTVFLTMSTRHLHGAYRTVNVLEPSRRPNFFSARRP